MSSRIPEDFGSAWAMSDAVLHTLDSDGKELHVNKSFLATFSPYFHAMFFGNFKEANEKHINLQCDYETLKEILNILYHKSRDYSTDGQKVYDARMQLTLHQAADMLDFPDIRKLCGDQLKYCSALDMANGAHSLGLPDMMMRSILSMDAAMMNYFISEENKSNLGSHLLFSKDDVAVMYEKIMGRELAYGYWNHVQQPPLRLNSLLKNVKDLRIDLNKKWPRSNIVLLTKSSLGNELHSNKDVLASVSPYFQKVFFENESEEGVGGYEGLTIEVDAEYATMKQILTIIHHCSNDFSRNGYTLIEPVLLYDMYITASVDNLDIPMIQKFCCDNLHDRLPLMQNTSELWISTFQAAVKLGLSELKSDLVKKLPPDDLHDWVYGNKVTYRRCGKKVVFTTENHEQVLNADDLRVLLARLPR